jgi:hypothetical protein
MRAAIFLIVALFRWTLTRQSDKPFENPSDPQRSMKTNWVPTGLAALLLSSAACQITSLAQHDRPGGYAKASVTNNEVVAAANYAIKARQSTMQAEKKPEPPKLELIKILQAEQQVVAGANYRLKLKVKLNGKTTTAEAIVWWQAWRKPDPYQLTSWTWQESAGQTK